MGDLELQVFANRLKEYRTQHGITQKDFAEKIGITAAALSAYEKNNKNPSIAVAKRIAETFNISIDWLCGLTSETNINGQLNTYADLIRLIIKITNAPLKKARWEVILQNEVIDPDTFDVCEYGILRTCDKHICTFFEEWQKMYRLYRDGTIDDYLYSLWLNDKTKKYENVALPFVLLDEFIEDEPDTPADSDQKK